MTRSDYNENQELYLQIGFVGQISENSSRRRTAKKYPFGFQAPPTKPKARKKNGNR